MANQKDDERKKGGIPSISFGRAAPKLAQGAASGAAAGARAAGGYLLLRGGATGLLMKLAVLGFLGVIGASAYNVGLSMNPNNIAPKSLGADRPLSRPDYVDASSPAPLSATGGSALQVVPEALDTRTPEQKAADAAEAERLAREAEKAAQPPDAAGRAAGGADGAGGAGGLGQYRSPSGRFGGSGSSALAGGSGLAGGVGNGFSRKIGAQQNWRPHGFGAGSFAQTSRASASPRVNSKLRGIAARQLDRANGLSRGAAAAGGEHGSTLADQAFSGGMGAGSVVSGAGAGTDSGAGGAQAGGPLGNQPTGGQDNASSGGGTSTPSDASSQNSTPWQNLVYAAIGMLLAAAAMLYYAGTLANAAKAGGPTAPALYAQAAVWAGLAAALGAGVVVIGMMIMGMGGKTQGLLMAAGGGAITIYAGLAMMGYMDSKAGLDRVMQPGAGDIPSTSNLA